MCSKTGTPHTTCNGRTAREAAIYPFQLCKAILEGLHQHLIRKGKLKKGINALLIGTEDFESDERLWNESVSVLQLEAVKTALGDVYDATTGQLLKGELVKQARRVVHGHKRVLEA